jgi:hypothetical protein
MLTSFIIELPQSGFINWAISGRKGGKLDGLVSQDTQTNLYQLPQ